MSLQKTFSKLTMKKKSIYFYSTSISYNVKGATKVDDQLYVNTSPLYLDAYLKTHRPDIHQLIEWSRIQLLSITQEQLINDLVNLDIDILCVSVYVWNQEEIYNLLKNIKSHLKKDIVIVAGGPSVDPHRNKNYFNEHPEIDYAVYAQGDSAFSTILDHVINKVPISLLTAKNFAWRDPITGTVKTADYEFIRYREISPYIESEELIKNIIDTYPGKNFVIPYETSKGCPYNCTFCDWTSGLSHKVTHRKVSIDDELQLLVKYKLTNIHMADANFGQHRQDIELAEKMSLLRTESAVPFVIMNSNFSKLRKKEVFYIAELFVKSGIMKAPKFAFEDIHDEVLTNIDRPCIPWQEHFEFIKDLKSKYPDAQYTIELIYGLPGQTRASWEETLCAFDGFEIIAYPWILLPNSPAGYDTEYQERMKINTQIARPAYFTVQDERSNLVTSTYSYTFDDYVYITAMYHLVRRLTNFPTKRRTLIDTIKKTKSFNNALDQVQKYFFYQSTADTVTASFKTVAQEVFEKHPMQT